MHVLIADSLPSVARAGLEALGLRVTEAGDAGAHSLPDRVADVDILVVSKTRVTKRTIEAAKALKLIVRAGHGTDTIDVEAASAAGVLVSHCPAADVSARAELVFGMAIALDRKLGGALSEPSARPSGLHGRTLGLYGYDQTAQAVQAVARGFGMRVLVYADAMTTALASEAGVRRAGSADELFDKSEVVSLHPMGASDEVVATAERIARLPEHAILINVARAGLIDLAAAKEAMDAGRLRLGLDVFDSDDYRDDVPFGPDHPALIATYRRAAQTAQALDATVDAVVEHIERYLTIDEVPDRVNAPSTVEGEATLVVRYRQGPSVLASTFEAIREAEIDVLGVKTVLFEGGRAGLASVVLAARPAPSVLSAIQRNPAVISAHVK